MSRAPRITCPKKTLVIFTFGSRFMARTLYEEGACHDFFGQDVRRKTMQRGPHLSDGTVRRILKLKGEFDQKVIP